MQTLARLISLDEPGRIGEIQKSRYLSVLDRKDVHHCQIDPFVGSGHHRAVTTYHHQLILMSNEFRRVQHPVCLSLR
jgi:hypothetical protein